MEEDNMSSIPKKRTRPSEDSSTPKKNVNLTAEAEKKEENEWELGGNKRVSISEFRGKTFVDIREYYFDSNGEMKPGRKGIALKPEQWDLLLSYAEEVNEALKKKL